jgi:hypothetical protein
MATVVHAIGWLVETLLRPLDELAPWASLAVVGALTAVILLVVIRWTSPQRRIRHARSQMAAALFEMRLYLDHPLQLLRAQARLFGWTIVYVLYLVPSMVVLVAPLGLLFVHLEVRHGLAPLPAPSTTVVRVEVAPGISPRDVAISAAQPLAVTARVHADDEHAVYARVELRARGSYPIVVRAGADRATAQLIADPDASVVSRERNHGIAQLWAFGTEPPLDGEAIRSITIPYPDRASPFAVPWWLYWLGIATVLAIALRRRFAVVF